MKGGGRGAGGPKGGAGPVVGANGGKAGARGSIARHGGTAAGWLTGVCVYDGDGGTAAPAFADDTDHIGLRYMDGPRALAALGAVEGAAEVHLHYEICLIVLSVMLRGTTRTAQAPPGAPSVA